MILAADVGGTKTNVGLFRRAGDRLAMDDFVSYPSRSYGGLDEIVESFVSSKSVRPSGAGFGVAGPVRDGKCRTTNLPWLVDAAVLADLLALGSVTLLNDLEATAIGLAGLGPGDFATLQQGDPDPAGNLALIAAGTGLGEAILFRSGGRTFSVASEGGHSDFGPRSEIEVELWRFLRERKGRVDYESIVSGPGLVEIYEFLHSGGRSDVHSPPWNDADASSPERGAAVTWAALANRCDSCRRSLELFIGVYGAEAGNLALKVLATGGMFVGGGIAPRILHSLRSGQFLDAFRAKGAFESLLAAVPVRVILNERTALIGAARAAARLPFELPDFP